MRSRQLTRRQTKRLERERGLQGILRRLCICCGEAKQEQVVRIQTEALTENGEEEGAAEGPGAVPIREYKGQLVNEILVAQWPFISKWFELILRDQVEPLVQKLMPAGITFSFGQEVSLGNTPLQLRRVNISSIKEISLQGDQELTSVRIGGWVNWRGDSAVDVDITGGSVSAKNLTLKAPIVIELVKLRTKPPWFSGLRVYFPGIPTIDMKVEAKVLNFNSGLGFVKHKIAKALATLIGRHAVLPNRFGVAFGDGIDTFDLKYPRPVGVLRIVVLEAVGLRAYSGAPWWRFDARREATADPYVEVSVGSCTRTTKTVKQVLTPKWGEEAVFDFVVDDPDRQCACFTVKDEDYGLLSWKPSDFLGQTHLEVSRLVDRQGAERGRMVPELWLQLWGEFGRLPQGKLRVRAQWRECADETDLDNFSEIPSLSSCWTIGVPSEAAFHLAADVYYATALPEAGADVPHWASVSIVDGHLPGAAAPPALETHNAVAVRPAEHGLALLRRQNVPNEVIEAFEDDPRRAHILWRRRVQAGLAPGEEEADGTVDAVWERSLSFLVDSLEAATLHVSVLRAANGKTRADGGIVMGTAECRLLDVLDTQRWSLDLTLPLQGGEAETGHIKLRLQIQPLRAPEVLQPGLFEAAAKLATGVLRPLRRTGRALTTASVGRLTFSNADFMDAMEDGIEYETTDGSASPSPSRFRLKTTLRHVNFLRPSTREDGSEAASSTSVPLFPASPPAQGRTWRQAVWNLGARVLRRGPGPAGEASPRLQEEEEEGLTEEAEEDALRGSFKSFKEEAPRGASRGSLRVPGDASRPRAATVPREIDLESETGSSPAKGYPSPTPPCGTSPRSSMSGPSTPSKTDPFMAARRRRFFIV